MSQKPKEKLRLTLQKVLRFFARIVLRKYKPLVVGITGSVGKTSAKEAVYAVLKDRFRVRRNIKNYNNEIGIPLTILGIEFHRSVLKWLLNLIKILGLIVLPLRYPKKLILEVGVDHPGDIKYLADFIDFKIGVITEVSAVHLEFFDDIKKLVKEKGTLFKVLPSEGLAILNRDSRFYEALSAMSKAPVFTFGFDERADVHLDGPVKMRKMEREIKKGQVPSLVFKVNYKRTTVPIRLPGAVGEHQVYAALAAIAVGLNLGMNLVEISESLKNYTPPPGRMKLLSGIKDSLIIDDTYNSSPKAALAALRTLGKIEGKRKIAVLGDMLELGPYTEKGHRQVGKKVSEVADILITVGPMAELILDEAIKRGFSKHSVFCFTESSETGRFLQNFVREGDLVLVKGSQKVRMEQIVKEIMAEPERAKELLCRQDELWLK